MSPPPAEGRRHARRARAKVGFTYNVNGTVTVEGPTGAALATPFEFDCGAGPGARVLEVDALLFAAEPPGAGEAGAVAAAAAGVAAAVASGARAAARTCAAALAAGAALA